MCSTRLGPALVHLSSRGEMYSNCFSDGYVNEACNDLNGSTHNTGDMGLTSVSIKGESVVQSN